MLLQRHILLPALFSAVLMFGLSYLWHGVLLKDLEGAQIPLGFYLLLAALVYLVIGFGLTFFIHKAIEQEWISLKVGFPLKCLLVGAVGGFLVYIGVFVMGFSYAKHGVVHLVADVLWQMFEQGMGGLAVSGGIIYDLYKRFLEEEQG